MEELEIIKGENTIDNTKMLWLQKKNQHIFLSEKEIARLQMVLATWGKIQRDDTIKHDGD